MSQCNVMSLEPCICVVDHIGREMFNTDNDETNKCIKLDSSQQYRRKSKDKTIIFYYLHFDIYLTMFTYNKFYSK